MIKCYYTSCRNFNTVPNKGFIYLDGKHKYWFCSRECINKTLKEVRDIKKIILTVEKALKEAKLNNIEDS